MWFNKLICKLFGHASPRARFGLTHDILSRKAGYTSYYDCPRCEEIF